MAEKKKQQYIMVMIRNTDMVPLGEWGMTVGYSIDYLGVVEAMRKAQEFIEENSRLYKNIAYKLQGGEW
tara:strand:+ start:1145 stop:1351 length:207 start_codon:yes stop_codon:yes gene_type:complete